MKSSKIVLCIILFIIAGYFLSRYQWRKFTNNCMITHSKIDSTESGYIYYSFIGKENKVYNGHREFFDPYEYLKLASNVQKNDMFIVVYVDGQEGESYLIVEYEIESEEDLNLVELNDIKGYLFEQFIGFPSSMMKYW